MNKIHKNANDKIKGKTLNKESEHMIKKIAWDTFKNTGDINTFLEFKQIENVENEIKEEHTKINLQNIYKNDNIIEK